jgi:hypothetical protein
MSGSIQDSSEIFLSPLVSNLSEEKAFGPGRCCALRRTG